MIECYAIPLRMKCAAWTCLFAFGTWSHEALGKSTDPPQGLPLVINTWGGPFTIATDAAYEALISDIRTTALDAVEIGCSACERNQCDGSVGYGGSPDENCETTLDAMIMDGATMNSGAVAGLRRVRSAIWVARHVMEHTAHSLLAGDLATHFAAQNGFAEEDLTTPESSSVCGQWMAEASCQPNYRVNVDPDPASHCGPYTPRRLSRPGTTDDLSSSTPRRDANLPLAAASATAHDTISMVVIDASGSMAAGTSTNGASHKIPGRVGDGPIVGSGSYVDADVGGCGATGDGDVMMRFLPCYQAVENLRRGMAPRQAAEDAVRRVLRKFPDVSSGIFVVNTKGEHGGAGSGWTFTYALRGGEMNVTQVVQVPPLTLGYLN